MEKNENQGSFFMLKESLEDLDAFGVFLSKATIDKFVTYPTRKTLNQPKAG